MDAVKPLRRRKIVVDETSIRIQKDAETLVEVSLWVAVDSDSKRIVHVALTQGRGGIEALGFIRGVLKRCTNVPFFHVDRGCWYPWALKTAGAPYEITKGGLRNRVETWNGILKSRFDDFRRRFLHNTQSKQLSAWLKTFAYCWKTDPLRTL